MRKKPIGEILAFKLPSPRERLKAAAEHFADVAAETHPHTQRIKAHVTRAALASVRGAGKGRRG